MSTTTRASDPDATIARVAVSMKCAMFVVSDVLMRIFPSGLIAMPSGSTPTRASRPRVRVEGVLVEQVLVAADAVAPV